MDSEGVRQMCKVYIIGDHRISKHIYSFTGLFGFCNSWQFYLVGQNGGVGPKGHCPLAWLSVRSQMKFYLRRHQNRWVDSVQGEQEIIGKIFLKWLSWRSWTIGCRERLASSGWGQLLSAWQKWKHGHYLPPHEWSLLIIERIWVAKRKYVNCPQSQL